MNNSLSMNGAKDIQVTTIESLTLKAWLLTNVTDMNREPKVRIIIEPNLILQSLC